MIVLIPAHIQDRHNLFPHLSQKQDPLLSAEYNMPNARLDEAQAGIKIAGRNINKLRYADDTTLMAESE